MLQSVGVHNILQDKVKARKYLSKEKETHYLKLPCRKDERYKTIVNEYPNTHGIKNLETTWFDTRHCSNSASKINDLSTNEANQQIQITVHNSYHITLWFLLPWELSLLVYLLRM